MGWYSEMSSCHWERRHLDDEIMHDSFSPSMLSYSSMIRRYACRQAAENLILEPDYTGIDGVYLIGDNRRSEYIY